MVGVKQQLETRTPDLIDDRLALSQSVPLVARVTFHRMVTFDTRKQFKREGDTLFLCMPDDFLVAGDAVSHTAFEGKLRAYFFAERIHPLVTEEYGDAIADARFGCRVNHLRGVGATEIVVGRVVRTHHEGRVSFAVVVQHYEGCDFEVAGTHHYREFVGVDEIQIPHAGVRSQFHDFEEAALLQALVLHLELPGGCPLLGKRNQCRHRTSPIS